MAYYQNCDSDSAKAKYHRRARGDRGERPRSVRCWPRSLDLAVPSFVFLLSSAISACSAVIFFYARSLAKPLSEPELPKNLARILIIRKTGTDDGILSAVRQTSEICFPQTQPGPENMGLI